MAISIHIFLFGFQPFSKIIDRDRTPAKTILLVCVKAIEIRLKMSIAVSSHLFREDWYMSRIFIGIDIAIAEALKFL